MLGWLKGIFRADKPKAVNDVLSCLRRVCALAFQAGGIVLFIRWRVGAERRAESWSAGPGRRLGRFLFGLRRRRGVGAMG